MTTWKSPSLAGHVALKDSAAAAPAAPAAPAAASAPPAQPTISLILPAAAATTTAVSVVASAPTFPERYLYVEAEPDAETAQARLVQVTLERVAGPRSSGRRQPQHRGNDPSATRRPPRMKRR